MASRPRAAPHDSDSPLAAALGILLAAAPAESVSVWVHTGDGVELACAAGGLRSAIGHLRPAAEAVLERRPAGDAHVSAARIEFEAGAAALLALDRASVAGTHDRLLQATGPTLGAMLAGGARVSPGPETDLSAAALERRLALLRFDLHDGPQQDVHLLAEDLRRFRDQLAPMLDAHPDCARALGRLDDLEAQLVALDDQLRRLATSVRSPLLVPGRLPLALTPLTETFTARTAIVPRTELRGEIDSLTDSQQIAILSVLREALSNIRRHSDAEQVEITIAAGADGVTVEVRDDGRGFDPGAARERAASEGRLGLVGIHRRAAMLGGRAEIVSRPGGPTVVSATLPRWLRPR